MIGLRLLAVSAVLCALIGCATTSTPQGPVTLTVFGDVNRVLDPQATGPGSINEFHALYPGIQVDVIASSDEWNILHHATKVLQSETETGPDIIEMPGSWVAEFAAKGQLLPLNDWFETLPAADRKDFMPKLLTAYSYQCQLYGLPSLIGIQYLYGRTDLLPKTGLPTTVKGLIEVSRSIQKEHGIQGVIFPSKGAQLAKFYYALFMIELANIPDKDRVLAHTRAYTNFSTLIRENQPDPEKYSHAIAEGEFRSGKAGLSINGNYVWYLLSQSKEVGFPVVPEDVTVGWLPVAHTDIPPVNAIWTRGYVINAKTHSPKEAQLLLDYLTSTQSQFRRLQDRYILPARTSAAFYGAALPGMLPAPAKALYKAGEDAPPIKQLNESPAGWQRSTEAIHRLLTIALTTGMTPAEVAGRMTILESMAQ
ncbi:extracellular solute-binding protein [Pseudodesulfovibrio sp. JC047]|uniref:ABC transporter substrate-binding protein n=1 Tax=Pseudodesulfovibrio sp. JC047 TaxID=2683199 RepID=UPI0013D8B9C5|nr:extracellular solute-binding protein [Pseudodesulfovibrio sp. JC047]NDV19256.1 extracellular solute-binding protein [Pseudodesulfovibrio sp. JC047]